MFKEKINRFKMNNINKNVRKLFNKTENNEICSSKFQGLKKTLQGKNNNFFLINDSNNEILQHYDDTFESKINYNKFIESIESKNNFFKQLNINYKLFVIPDKSITLREYLPFKTNNPNRHVNHLKGYLYDLNEIITKEDTLSNDTHISEKASPKIISYIISKIYPEDCSQFEKELNDRISLVPYEHEGDLFNEQNWSYNKDQSYYENKYVKNFRVELKDEYKEIPLKNIPEEFRYVSKRKSHYYINKNALLDKKALILHDSTTEKLTNTLIATYKEVFFYWDHWYFNKDLINWFKPDDVIEIRTERFLENALTPIINENYCPDYPNHVILENFEVKSNQIELKIRIEDKRKIGQEASINIFIDEKNIKNDSTTDGNYSTTIALNDFEYKDHDLKINIIDTDENEYVINRHFPFYESLEPEFKELKSCYKGKNDTFFKVNDKNNELRQHYDRMYKFRIDIPLFNNSISSKKIFLNEQNIEYGLFAIPDKSVVLSRHIPFNDSKAIRLIEKLDNVNDLLKLFCEEDFLKNDFYVEMKSTIKATTYILNKIFNENKDYEKEITKRVNISEKKHNGSLFTNKAWSYEKDELHKKYYTVTISDVIVKNYSEVNSSEIPDEFKVFSNRKSRYFKNDNPIINQKVLILNDHSINPFIPSFVASFKETFFYYDEWYFNKDLIEWFNPDIVLEIREECKFENPICQNVSILENYKVPIIVEFEDFKSENDKLNLEIEVHDLKTLKVNTRCKLLIDNKEISTIDTENGLAEYKMDITDITNGEHVLELHINETSNTKSAIIKKKFIK